LAWLSLLLVLALEQLRPLPMPNPVYRFAAWLTDSTEEHLNAGSPRHGVYAWLLLVLGGTLLAGVLYAFAISFTWLLGVALNVAVLYFTLGFRQFSRHFTEIRICLANGDLAGAQRELTEWKRHYDEQYSAADLDAGEVLRQAIEHGLLLAHRHVYGVFFWFVVLPGPMGPIFYRAAEYLARRWNRPAPPPLPTDDFGRFARTAFGWIDWLPARMTALGFAIVGDFEGAVYCWRKVKGAGGFPGAAGRAVVLGAASGAVGTRIMSEAESTRYFDEPGEEGAGLQELNASTARSLIALAWRALILWLIVLLALTLAGWLT
jgi:adenosylcobinamide-phosphate synthase